MSLLWFDKSELIAVRARIENRELISSGYFAIMKSSASRSLEEVTALPDSHAWNSHVTTRGDLFLASCGFMYLYTENCEYSNKAFNFIRYWTSSWITADVTMGHWATHIAAAYNCCYEGWDEEQRKSVQAILLDIMNSTFDIQRVSPHVMTNNHWAISFGGAAIAAMALSGTSTKMSPETMQKVANFTEFCLNRIRAFLGLVGEHGGFHEGASYLMYSFTTLLPAIIAAQRLHLADFETEFPFLQHAASYLYSLAAVRPIQSDSGEKLESYGMMLSWNNCPVTWDQSHVALLLILFAPAEQRGALTRIYWEMRGFESDKKMTFGSLEPFFGIFFYQFDSPLQDPDTVLPHHLTDYRNGTVIFRREYQGADDTIIGLHCRTTGFSGGNMHDDAGSVRLMSKGHDWIMGGGQLRPAAMYQSVVTPHDEGERPKPYGTGTLLWNQSVENGGMAAVDLRDASRAYHERYLGFDWSGMHGNSLSMALLDILDDHKSRAWDWGLTFEPGLLFRPDPDNFGFSLFSADGWELGARFIGSMPTTVSLHKVPATTRKFTSGFSRDIAERPFVRASFGASRSLAIYVVLTIGQSGERPFISSQESTSVKIGSWQWSRPFGLAVPERFNLLSPPGILSKYPSGIGSLLCKRFTGDQRTKLVH